MRRIFQYWLRFSSASGCDWLLRNENQQLLNSQSRFFLLDSVHKSSRCFLTAYLELLHQQLLGYGCFRMTIEGVFDEKVLKTKGSEEKVNQTEAEVIVLWRKDEWSSLYDEFSLGSGLPFKRKAINSTDILLFARLINQGVGSLLFQWSCHDRGTVFPTLLFFGCCRKVSLDSVTYFSSSRHVFLQRNCITDLIRCVIIEARNQWYLENVMAIETHNYAPVAHNNQVPFYYLINISFHC